MASSITLYDDAGNPVVVDGETMGIETVTNANGTAIKYPDGTMICLGETVSTQTTDAHGNVYRSPSETVTFAEAFISQPNITFGVDDSSGSNSWASKFGTSTTTQIVLYLSSASTTAVGKVTYQAIGRWK